MLFKKNILCLSTFIFLLSLLSPCYATQILTASKVDIVPVIDGKADDPAWRYCDAIITYDKITNIAITIKAVYTPEKIFFLVHFPDADESRIHKPLVWNPEKKMYETGPDRGDCFIFKWAMNQTTKDLTLHANQPYSADIWFWKANRTDPVGYSDDKFQILTETRTFKSKELKSSNGKTMYLQRIADRGEPAYKSSIIINYEGDKRTQYKSQTPSGSRADIKAKGKWLDKKWCIEFSRNLNTHQKDDIQFYLSKKYFFGVARYEIAGRKIKPNMPGSLYGAGDVNEKLYLIFKP